MSEENRPIHDRPIGQLTANDLRRLEASCADVIGEICHVIADKAEAIAAIRQLMHAEDTDSGLDSLRQSSPGVAELIINAAFGVLVNSMNLVSVRDELQRRAREAN